MAIGSSRKSGGMAALVAGLALLALPAGAHAQERDHGRGGGGDRQGHGGGQPTPSPAPAPAPAPRAQVQQHNAPQGGGNGGRWNGGGQGGQHGRSGGQVQAPAAVTPRAQPRDWSRNGQGQSGNHGYVAPNRNGGYRDTNRDTVRGREEGARWQGNSNGQRGNDGNRWQGGDRSRGGRQDFAHNWNRDWRGDHRYDWRDYRQSHRDIFHMRPYYAPYRNYSYRRFGIGSYLDSLFFGSNYWINDPWDYRLPPAEGPYHWVRYYDDALLVNTYTGEVADVIYDFFW